MAEQRLSILNANPRRLPGPDKLHDLVSGPTHPSRAAIDYLSKDGQRRTLTYADLHSRADALAHRILHTYRLRRESSDEKFIVPLFVPQSPELYVAQLAILKAGGAFCPIALDAPEDRLRYILQDVGAQVLLTVPELEHQLPSVPDLEVLCVSDVSPVEHLGPPEVATLGPDPAYVMYTSGSTGTPKGVLLSHSAATQALLAHEAHIPSFSRFLQFANPTFDVSVFEIFFPFFRGATLVCCDRRRLLNDLPGVMNDMAVDAAELTPSVASTLLPERASVPSLRALLTIGEMLKRSVVDEYASSSESKGILYGMYGPTEATIHCTLQPDFEASMAVNNIGIPLDTVSAFVVKPQEDGVTKVPEVLPIGEEGELAVGGYQLADGYLNRDEQTKAAFVDHPTYGRIYRTGDRARMTPQGTLECLGRISSGQVKLRGQRIELGEVEYAVTRAQGCKSAVAEVIEGALVAFCVANSSGLDINDVRQTSSKWLPAFMVPTEILVLDDLPYLASGKIDRKALLAYYSRHRQASSHQDKSYSEDAVRIATILSTVLRREVPPSSNLQSIGLDSLSAIRFASELHRGGFPRPDATVILEARTISDLESAMKGKAIESSGDPKSDNQVSRSHPLLAKASENAERVYQATPIQCAMLVETAKDPSRYCNSVSLAVTGYGIDQVKTAIVAAVQRHELLRSGFVSTEQSASAFAAVVWPRLCDWQVTVTETFDHRFALEKEDDFLRPLSVQLRKSQVGVEVLLKLHHALYDQWSIDVLKADLAAELRGKTHEPPTQFLDVSAFHTANSESIGSEEALDFWQTHLSGFTSTTVPLMNGRFDPPALKQTPWHDFGVDLLEARRSAADLGYSLPTLYQAAYGYLLSLYSGSADVTFGTVFSGRHISVAGIESVFGPCLSTLPSRLDLSGVNSCLDLLRLTQDRNRAMQRHSLTPLVDIKKAIRHTPGESLFDSLFIWQETSLDMAGTQNAVTELSAADRHEYNFVLELEPTSSGVRARATYQQQLIPSEQAQLALQQIGSIARYLLKNPQEPVEKLLGAFSRQQLSCTNAQPSTTAPSREIVSTMEMQVDLQPDQMAVEFAERIDEGKAITRGVTYTEFNCKVNKLARFLRSNGVSTGGMVCICMEKSVGLYVSILAVLKAGAGYLPVLPETPRARLEAILRQADVQACMVDNTSESTVRSVSAAPVLRIDQLDLQHYESSNLNIETTGSNVAYMVFTSGSTGEPKGVCVTRDNLAGNLAVLAELYPVTNGDRLLQACSHAFDVSVFEIFFALTSGMCLCSAVKDVLFRDLEQSIRALNITHLSLTPTVASLINPENVPSIKFLVTAGEGVTDTVRRRWAGHGLHQGYGPSETTNICSVHMDMRSDDPLGNVGPPLRNTSAFVIAPDRNLELLPAGAVGEFAFGGEQVFPGYVARDDLNAEKLINHPDFGRIYRSGDFGRLLHDGTLLISGRLDDQVKLRGNRVELGEINAAMIQRDEVFDCSTMVIEDSHMGQILVAFWVPSQVAKESSQSTVVTSDDEGSVPTVFEHLEAFLPSYMVPSILVPISKIPMTAQTKLDKKLLRSLFEGLADDERSSLSRDAGEQDDGQDWSEGEILIADVLSEVLKIPRGSVGRTTSFFALGVNSLSTIAFAKKLGVKFGQSIGIAQVLSNASVARLNRTLTQKRYETRSTDAENLDIFSPSLVQEKIQTYQKEGIEVEAVLPCTPLQEAMLSASASNRSDSYQNRTRFRIIGDIQRLRACWQELVSRHAILRTRFEETESPAHPYMQLVLKHSSLPWQSHKTHGNASTTLRVTYITPFLIDIEQTQGQDFMTLRMHHAIYDGMSMSLLLEEAEQLYAAHSLPPAPSFRPFIAEVLEQNTSEAIDYWRGRLQGYKPRPFRSMEKASESSYATFRGVLPFRPAELDEHASHQSTTSSVLFQASWTKVLAHLQSTNDVCFGNVVSGRTVSVDGVERLVAPCFNTIPVRIDLTNHRTNGQLVKQLHESTVRDQQYQLSSLRRLQSLSANPSAHLFDSILLIQPPESSLDANIWEQLEEEGSMDMPIVFEVTPGSDHFAASVHFTSAILSENMAEAIVQAFTSALSASLRFGSSELRFLPDFDASALDGTLAIANDSDQVNEQHNSDESATWTSVEEKVREVLGTLSGVSTKRISKSTSMYQLGLDSLNTAQVASRLRKLGLNIDAMDVAESLTPAAIARKISDGQDGSGGNGVGVDLAAFDTERRGEILGSLGIDSHDVQAVRPCTAVQSGMIAQSLHSSGDLYVNHVTFEVPNGVTYEAIRSAWETTLSAMPSLRMGFAPCESQYGSFAMILYQSQKGLNFLKVFEEQSDMTTLTTGAASDIVTNLHQPAWRVSLVQTHGAATMTLSLHHALYDADSLESLMQCFYASLAGKPTTTGSVDTILQRILQSEKSCAQEGAAFWEKRLESLSVMKFPDLNPTWVEKSEKLVVSLESKLKQMDLDHYCRSTGVTTQALGQAAWAILLSAYIGEPNVTFGTVFSARSGSQNESITFPAISTIPVSCSVTNSHQQLVKEMVAYNASIQRYRFTPLSSIQRFAGLPGQSLFDTVFVYQKGNNDVGSEKKWSMVHETSSVDYAASVELEVDANGKIALRLTVDSANVPSEHADLILKQYESILTSMLDSQEILNDVPGDLVSKAPAKERSLPSSASLLHHFVEIQARNVPEHPALEFIRSLDHSSKTQRWSYKQLNERGNQVAHLLRANGVQSGNTVAVRMHKSPEASFAFLGILKAGCAFLALDPELPKARQEFILGDSGARVLFINDVDPTSDHDLPTRVVTLSEKALKDFPLNFVPEKEITPEATSYCLYTSGTTGTPKGCELTHENAVQAMLAFQRLFKGRWNSSSRWLQFASYWFDVSVLEQFWSWSVGITVVGAPRDLVLDDLPGFIEEAKITHIDLTPSLARMLHPDDVTSLHPGVFITGGEALKQEIIDAWGPKHTVCNGYGPTEATIGVTMNTFVGTNAKPSNIGPPFDNVGAFIFRPGTDIPVLRGAVGELCVSGKLVGKGYLNRPELTAKSFPYLESLGERVYRTGDLCRLLADGSISFLGRIDTQAKLRGQRLEIGEIDSVIASSSEDIVDVVSLVHKDKETGKETLVSFIVTMPVERKLETAVNNSDNSLQQAKRGTQACKDSLPGYMVPTHIIPITRLPLTVNNKVDAKRLTALFESLSPQDLQSLKGARAEKADLNETESRLAQVICTFFQIDRSAVDRDANLFSLGMSSISVLNLSSLLRKKGYQGASVATIMKNPVLHQLSSALSDSDGHNTELAQVKQTELSMKAFAQRHRSSVLRKLNLESESIEAVTPCTPLQEGLILESMRQAERPYFNEFHYKLKRAMPEKIMQTVNLLAREMDILRTKYVQNDHGFAQVFLTEGAARVEAMRLVLHTSDTSALTEQRSEWLSANEHDLREPVRVVVASSGTETTLVFFVHHAVYDGISWELILSRLAQIYNGQSCPHMAPSFRSILSRGPLRSIPEAKSFWQQRMMDVEVSQLDVTSPAEQAPPPPPTITALSTQSSDRVDIIRKQLGVSHQAALQACFEAALVHHFSQIRTYGHVVSGRSIGVEGAENVIGPLFNTLPTAISMDPSSSWGDSITNIHSRNVATVPYQHTSLRDIKKWCSQSPSQQMFDVLFVFQHSVSAAEADDNGLWEQIEMPTKADYPLAFEVTLQPDNNIEIMAVAQGRIMSQDVLEGLVSSFCRALQLASDDFRQPVNTHMHIPKITQKRKDVQRPHEAAHLNGVHDFEWTKDALALRDAIAQTAGVGEEVVDEHTTIFTLGLDSIDAVRLASRIKKTGLSLPVSKILQAQTIPRMLHMAGSQHMNGPAKADANRLGDLSTRLTEGLERSGYGSRSVERVLPATPHQEALIADMLRSDMTDYYNHDIVRVELGVDVQRLQKAWQTVLDYSPILRTAFVQITDPTIDVTFAQVVHRPGVVTVSQHSISDEGELQGILQGITKDARSSFGSRPSTAVTAVKKGKQHYLILSLAHAQYDGHSLALIHDDVRRAYDEQYVARPSYDSVIEASLASTSKEARTFWIDALSGAKPSRFPSKASNEQTITHYRAERTSKTSLSTARSFCQANGISMQALAQTTWALALAHYTRNLEVLYGVVLACRDSEEAEQILFPTMNTVPVRAALHGSRKEMLRDVQSAINDVRLWQRTPLRSIQAACGELVRAQSQSKGDGDVDASGGLFDTLFIYQARPDADDGVERQKLYDSIGGSSSVEFPVAVEMEAVSDELILRAACKGSVMDRRGTEVILEKMDKLLATLIKDADPPTVAFSEHQASVCGLEWITLASEKQGEDLASKMPEQVLAPETSEATLSPVAVKIREALAQVAKVPAESISPTTSIENVGIDSISAIKVTALLRKQGVKLAVSEVVRAKSVARMAEILSNRKQDTHSVHEKQSADAVITQALERRGLSGLLASSGIEEREIETVLPATAGQVYMLSVWKNSGGQLFYPTFEYEVPMATISVSRLHQAWKGLVQRHAMLRTVFYMTYDEEIPVLQVALKTPPQSFHDETEKTLHRGVPKQPMTDLSVSNVNEGHYRLSLKIHHALYDAVSLPLLMHDFNTLLLQQEPRRSTIKYEEFLALSLPPQVQQGKRNFWTNYLADIKQPLRLRQPSSVGTESGLTSQEPKTRVEIFKPSLLPSTAELDHIARKEGITVQALLFAAYAQIYAALASKTHQPRHSNSSDTASSIETEDLLLGIYLSSRALLPSLEHLPAPTLNLVPLAIRAPRSKPLVALAREVQRDLERITNSSPAEDGDGEGGGNLSSVGLWEIKQWTGREVDTFVNFLRVPGDESGDDGDSARNLVREVDSVAGKRKGEGYARVVKPRSEQEELGMKENDSLPAELRALEKIAGAYPFSLDLEAALSPSGTLDVGIFCPEAMLGLEEAEGVLEGLRGKLSF
ncbi:peptide synthetase [Hortaea werneckii]|nr:peptide synthetase [Hortaea werneckii]KAI7095727.1 peptide synthetase [Hortaea werneckii]KAI7224608.1 peptide synthetase [Hortaea werneckii]